MATSKRETKNEDTTEVEPNIREGTIAAISEKVTYTDPIQKYFGGTPVSQSVAAADAAAEHKAMVINGTSNYVPASLMNSQPG